VGDGITYAVNDRARRPKAAPAIHDRLAQRIITQDVQEGILLSSKGQVGQVLGGGG
jgi:hypothetical protein